MLYSKFQLNCLLKLGGKEYVVCPSERTNLYVHRGQIFLTNFFTLRQRGVGNKYLNKVWEGQTNYVGGGGGYDVDVDEGMEVKQAFL